MIDYEDVYDMDELTKAISKHLRRPISLQKLNKLFNLGNGLIKVPYQDREYARVSFRTGLSVAIRSIRHTSVTLVKEDIICTPEAYYEYVYDALTRTTLDMKELYRIIINAFMSLLETTIERKAFLKINSDAYVVSATATFKEADLSLYTVLEDDMLLIMHVVLHDMKTSIRNDTVALVLPYTPHNGLKEDITYVQRPNFIRVYIQVKSMKHKQVYQATSTVMHNDKQLVGLRSNCSFDSSPESLVTSLFWQTISALPSNLSGYLIVKHDTEFADSQFTKSVKNIVDAKFPINSYELTKVKVKPTKPVYVKPDFSWSYNRMIQLTGVKTNIGKVYISYHSHIRYIERSVRLNGKYNPNSYLEFQNFLANQSWRKATAKEIGEYSFTSGGDVIVYMCEDSSIALVVAQNTNFILTVLVKGYAETYADFRGIS